MIFELFDKNNPNSREERRAFPRVINPDAFVRFDHEMGSLNTSTFILKDLSLQGFSIFVGELDHPLVSGEKFSGKLRLHDKYLEFSSVLRWVGNSEAGFHFEQIQDNEILVLKNYLDPIELGRSLKRIKLNGNSEKLPAGISIWYHGKLGTELYFWGDEAPRKWQFVMGSQFVEWEHRLYTGELVTPNKDSNPLYAEKEYILKFDAEPRAEILEKCQKILKFSEIEPSHKKMLNSSFE